jgi:hypothetical protein
MDAAAIKALRLRLGFTQEVLAQKLNVSVSTVRAWEQGARLPSGAATRLLQHMGGSPRENPDGAGRPSLRRNLPTVATVAGVKVMIFYADHAPPHVHLSKDDMDIVALIEAPDLPPWAFSRADRRAVLRWVKSRRAWLVEAWDRAQRGEPPGDAP